MKLGTQCVEAPPDRHASTMRPQLQREEAWTRYWASGAEHSCAGSFALQGDGDTARLWADVFGNAPASARILDVGSGNGGLLQVALSQQQPGWQLLGVDLAGHQPGWLEERKDAGRVSFLSGIRMEAMPIEDGWADLLVSQFGVEYGKRGAVQAECLRVLAPRGRFALVMHHRESAISAVARDELRAHECLLGEDGLLAAAAALLPHLADARAGRQPGPEGDQARLAFNEAVRSASGLAQALSAPDLLWDVLDGLPEMLGTVSEATLASLQMQLAGYTEELATASLRSAEQLECALSEMEMEQFAQPFVDAGCTISIAPLHEGDRLIAWQLRGQRA